MSKDYTIEALEKTINYLKNEGFEVMPSEKTCADLQKEEKTGDETTEELVKEIARRFLEELKGEVKENTLEVEVIENPNPTEEGEDKYLTIPKLQIQEENVTEDTDGEISIKAIRQRGRYTKEEPEVKKDDDET